MDRLFWLSILLLVGCSTCDEPAAALLSLSSANGTVLHLDLDGFGLHLQHESGRQAHTGTGDDCPPFAVAMRPDGSDPRRFHAPDNPPDDLVWLSARRALPDGVGRWRLELSDATGQETAQAILSAKVGDEGFVDLDFEVDQPEAFVALIQTCFTLPTDQPMHVVGGGEIFEGVDLFGRVVPLFFQAPAATTSGLNEKHAPVPFVATSAGLGVWAETERVGAADVGASDPSQLILRFQGKQLALRLRLDSIPDNAAAHARRAGLPPMPPRWVLTPQLWRNELAVSVEGGEVVSDGRDRYLDDARRLRALGIPGSVLWIDAPWSTGYNTFTFNETQFPEPAQMLAEAERLGFRTIAWATEQINSSNDEDQQVGMPEYGSLDLFEQWRDADYLVKTSQGDPFEFPWGRGYGGFPDFTNPDAFAAYGELARPLLRMGIRGFKLDFCETMRPDLIGLAHNDAPVFADGSTTEVQHTRYARLFHEAMIRVLQEEHPDDWYVITRTGGLHDQRNGTTLWPGDLDNDWGIGGVLNEDGDAHVGGLQAAISGGLSAALSGYPLYGSDIGGYRGGTPTTEVLLRWAQFGALSTVMQLGGGGTGDATHHPWDERYDTEVAIPIYRRYARLHMRLLPTLEALVKRATTTGHAPLLPVGVVAGTEAAWADRNTFVFGERLLAAPVVEPGADQRQLVLPAGRWIDWWEPQTWLDGGEHRVAAPLDHMPLYQRAGSVIALAHPDLMTAVDAADDSVADPASVGDAIEVRTSPGPKDVLVLADGTRLIQEPLEQGMHVLIEQSEARKMVIHVQFDAAYQAQPEAFIDGQPIALMATESDPWTCDSPCYRVDESALMVTLQGRQLEVRP